MKKIYYLATCSTCKRIIKFFDLPEDSGVKFQNIKKHPLTPEQLDEMKELAGSYEALFSRRSGKYSSIKDKGQLKEEDYRRLILEEYTFLRRPVVLVDDKIFIGNANPAVHGAAEALKA